MKTIAIVTGASSGVGQEFCRQLDEGAGGPLAEIWAIARNERRLQALVEACAHVPIRPIPLDLSDSSSFVRLREELEREQPRVQWLVNSAGFGTFGTFEEIGEQANVAMVTLNCQAVVEMCALVLPYVLPGSRIINLASIAGAIPQVELACYSATKAFVLELSTMLDHELKGGGVHVTAVCPKFMRTRFLDEPGNAQAASGMCRIGFEEVSKVVRRALSDALRGRAVSIPSPDMRLAALVARHIPRSLLFNLEDLLFR